MRLRMPHPISACTSLCVGIACCFVHDMLLQSVGLQMLQELPSLEEVSLILHSHMQCNLSERINSHSYVQTC